MRRPRRSVDVCPPDRSRIVHERQTELVPAGVAKDEVDGTNHLGILGPEEPGVFSVAFAHRSSAVRPCSHARFRPGRSHHHDISERILWTDARSPDSAEQDAAPMSSTLKEQT
jgi:hypothetical protein